MKKIYELLHSVVTKQTLYFVKYITFLIIVTVLLLEKNSVILYSGVTYLAGVAFDSVAISKKLSVNQKNKLYIVETIIMSVSIASSIAITLLKLSGYTNIPFGRELLNAALIVTTPHPLIEGLIKIQEEENV